MTEENTQNETQTQEHLENQPAPAQLPNDRPAENVVAELQRKLDAQTKINDDRVAAEKAAEEKKALDNKEFEKVIASQKEENAKLKSDFESQKTKNAMIQFDSKLLSLGIQNEFTRDGIVSKIMSQEPEARDAFLEDLQKSNPDLFTSTPKTYKTAPAGTVSQNAQGGEDWNAIKKVIDNPRDYDQPVIRKAMNSRQEHIDRTGKEPPGF